MARILKDLYKDYFRIGVACEKINEKSKNHEIGNAEKEALILKHFNSMTFANELKPAYNMGFNSPEATEDFLPFVINPYAKDMLDWAKNKGMSVRGHVLVWHSQCPKEIFCKGYNPVTFPTDPELLKEKPFFKFFEKLNPVCFVDRETLLKRLKSYIFNLMDYMYQNDYSSVIYAWDVVNEAIELQDNTPTGHRNSYWYQIIGDDFIYWAFKYTREAIDGACKKYNVKNQPKLFYNDYNEWQPEKKTAIINVLKADGPDHGSIIGEKLIDGIGMQGHLSDNNNIDEYISALKEYGALVNEVHITELDVKSTCTTINEEYYQAVFFKELFEKLVEVKKQGTNLTCVTLWGLTDDNSWIRDANPLIFRGDLSEKKSFDGLVYALSGESLGEPAEVKIDLSDKLYDFEIDSSELSGDDLTSEDNKKVLSNKLEEMGFKMKGFGECHIQNKVVHSGNFALANEQRFGGWSGISFDVSDFVGQTISVGAWVKSSALEVVLKAASANEPEISSVAATDWAYLQGRFKIPKNVHSMQLFFTTKEDSPDKFSPVYVDKVEVKLIGLEESFEEEVNIASIRGAGHLPVCYVTDKESKDGKSHSYCITRHEKDATVKFDVSSYIGNTIEFKAYVKTSDKKIKLGLDGAVSKQFACVDLGNDWTEISALIPLPKELKSAEVYIETDGNADYFVDDIFVCLKK